MVAEKGFVRTAEVLLDFQADPYVKDRAGKPPIYYATANNHYKMVRLLISYGEDITQVFPEGNTLLHLAAEKGTRGCGTAVDRKGCCIECE